MSQSLTEVYLHIVFSTKHREKLIDVDIENELHDYIGGICKNLKCNPVKIGGERDHVHILCMLSKNVTIAKLVEDIKKSSSKWIKDKNQKYSKFYWQDGYGAFSVHVSQIEEISSYILHQKEQHKRFDFKQELLAILKKLNVDYNPKYLWD